MTKPDPRSNSKRRKGDPARAGYDDPRYRNNRQRLKVSGAHICAWCRTPIDMQLTYPHPLSWSCDHIVPRSHLHPNDPRHWHISNMQELHRRCNSARGNKPMPLHPAFTPLDTTIEW